MLDGHHRVQIADELGIRYRKLVRKFDSDEEKVEHAIKLNLLRRHLGPIAWAEAFRELCRVRGVRLGSGAQKQNGNGKATASRKETATIAALAQELGVAPRTARWRIQIATKLADQPDLADRVDRGAVSAQRALREARERRSKVRRARLTRRRLPKGIRIEKRDFRKLKVAVASADLIVADPPYSKKSLDLYGDLATFAERALKPTGALLAYSGMMYLPQVIEALGQHLQYIWTCCIVHQGRTSQVHPHMIRSGSKVVLVYARTPKYRCRRWMPDTVLCGQQEKSLHPWQQSEAEVEHFLDHLTQPGDLVIDPFLGSGTTAVAAQKLGRQFLGCDVDADAVAVARGRVGNRSKRQSDS